MIYDFPQPDVPIRQGDIFIGLPRIEVSLERVILADREGEVETSWNELADTKEPVDIVVPVRPVAAIVATQDCDALRSRDITLCEIRPFREVERKTKDTTSPNSWKNILTQHARVNQKWFYLPPDTRVGFADKMAVDFLVTLCLPLEDLKRLRARRLARLNQIADEHFRERISEFFRRYPYDEWYALDRGELDAYTREYPGTRPFKWQKS